jgi:hypothetical protein
MSLIPYGLNPDETWECDFAATRAQHELLILSSTEKAVRDEAATKSGEEQKALVAEADRLKAKANALEAELKAYVPRSGPVFTIGAIPNALRAEIAGERQENVRLEPGPERARREVAAAEKIIRWAVRGHENLLSRSGAAVPFVADTIEWEGRKRPSPARQTLEAYQPILHDLALQALKSQRLDDTGKNG